MRPAGETPEIGRDALDPAGAPGLWAQLFPARQAAFGLAASPAPSVTFIGMGVALGPQALGVITPDTIARLDPVVSIALAALGIFVGLGLGAARQPGHATLAAAAMLEVAMTVAVVGGAFYFLLTQWGLPLPADPALVAAVLGISASASAATRVPGSGIAARVSRIVDLDDLPIVLLGALVVGYAAGRPLAAAVVVSVTASLLVAAAGWLLFERARGEAERIVFVAGAVALLGGVGAYAGVPPLLGGAVAALVWVLAPGAADRIIDADLRKLQHPLVALLLIIAGASVQWTTALLWIAAPLVLLRLTGKLLASAAAARLARVPAGLLATVLVHPGVLGVAVALAVQQVLDTRDTLLLSGVTVAAAVTELLSAFLLPGEPGDDA